MSLLVNDSDLVLMIIRGDDRMSWWSGQVTAEVKPALEGTDRHAVYGLVLNAKGRIVSDALTLIHEGDAIHVTIPRSAATALVEHLDRYIIMEDVALTISDSHRVFSIVDTGSEAVLPGAVSSPRYTRASCRGFELLLDQDAVPTKSIAGALLAKDAFDDALTRCGIPHFGLDFGDFTYPQEVELETLAVSFNKGCYLGQEVVCMLESRGQISRKLRRFRSTIDHTAAITPQTKLFQGDHEVGMITSSATHDVGAVGFALVKSSVTDTFVHVGAPNAATVIELQ